MDKENLGPAEQIVSALTGYVDHAYHGRPGIVRKAATSIGVSWSPATHRVDGARKLVAELQQSGRKKTKVELGEMRENGEVRDLTGRVVGTYRPAGLQPEVVEWMYKQIADVWKLDNEFAARWASHIYQQDHKDRRCVAAAFMLVQGRKGDPVIDAGEVSFFDDDFRDVGEAMLLVQNKEGFDAKQILRTGDILNLKEVAKINRDLKFGQSLRKPFLGRWPLAVEKWLRYREQNPVILERLVKSGQRTMVMELARRVGYKPETDRFFELLRWKQKQSEDGRRVVAIGKAVKAAESWAELTEEQICERIGQEKPKFKRLSSLVPPKIGLTRAIVAAAIEAGSLSDKDLVIATPTLETLGLLEVPEIKARWEAATNAAVDMRAANIARNIKTKETREKLEAAADVALQKAVEAPMKDFEVYVMVDKSGSMTPSIEAAKRHLARFLQAFPLEHLHVSVFDTSSRALTLKAASAVAVENAFRGIAAGGGTDYGAGVMALSGFKPAQGRDALFIFVGDEEANGFAASVIRSGLNPAAFGLIKVGNSAWNCVQKTAIDLGLPCFLIDEQTFADPYAIPRTIRTLMAAAPARAESRRTSLIDEILKTELLKKPVWA